MEVSEVVVLFLDWDGVLHPGNPVRAEQRYTKVPLLADWLRQWPQVRVVISSAWRKQCTLDALREIFPEDLRSRIVGVTPVLKSAPSAPPSGPRHEREMEVGQWLQASTLHWTAWAVIDDSPWEFRAEMPELVVANQSEGLTPALLTQLERVLGLDAKRAECHATQPSCRHYLFVDFDGCMHPRGSQVDQFFCHQLLLEAWLRERPGVAVVISSSWRTAHPLDELQSYFAEDLRHRVIGVTPVLPYDKSRPLGYERELEIEHWLSEQRCPEAPWAALDDQAELFAPGHARVVICDSSVGLTQSDLYQLDEVYGVR